jgi:hypothetical protein
MLLLGLLPWSSIITYRAVRFRPATSVSATYLSELRRHIDYAARTTFQHVVQNKARTKKSPTEIDVQHKVPVSYWHLSDA